MLAGFGIGLLAGFVLALVVLAAFDMARRGTPGDPYDGPLSGP